KVRNWKKRCGRYFDDEDRPGTIQNVDWGKQIDTYVNGGELEFGPLHIQGQGRDVEDQLGFTYISDAGSFKKSIEFFVVAAYAARVPGSECPEELQTEVDGQTVCDIPEMRGMGRWQQSRDG